MVKKYKSGLGIMIIAMIVVCIGFISTFNISSWVDILVSVLFLLFFTILIKYVISTTFYTIHENILNINGSFGIKIEIEISSITSIANCKSIMSSPALSLDRIELKYANNKSVIISPKDKQDFIADLCSKNSSIELIGIE